jgi:hypothetical protein
MYADRVIGEIVVRLRELQHQRRCCGSPNPKPNDREIQRASRASASWLCFVRKFIVVHRVDGYAISRVYYPEPIKYMEYFEESPTDIASSGKCTSCFCTPANTPVRV